MFECTGCGAAVHDGDSCDLCGLTNPERKVIGGRERVPSGFQVGTLEEIERIDEETDAADEWLRKQGE